MTKETNQDNTDASGGGAGGPKKFLYTGPKKKNTGFKEATNNPSNASLGTMSPDSSASVNDMWKHITVSSHSSKPGYQEGWTKSVDKGFYSRHGGLNPAAATDSSSRTWTGASGYQSSNYSTGRKTGTDPLGNTPDQASSSVSLGQGSRYFNNNNRKF